MVIAPKQPELERLARGRAVIPGKGDYDAILELEPGTAGTLDADLAAALSRVGTSYTLWLDDERTLVRAFDAGEYVGDVNAYPDAVARHLKCTFPTCHAARAKVDLTPHRPPRAVKGTRKIAGFSVAEWTHFMRSSDYGALVDGAGARACAEVLVALSDPSPEARRVGAKLARAISVHGGDPSFAPAALAALEGMARDPEPSVRSEAKRSAAVLAEAIASNAVHAELPWIRAYDPADAPRALVALADARPAARYAVVGWWSAVYAGDLAPADRHAALEALRSIRATCTKELRASIDVSLAQLEGR